jgi:hypothetical protein
VVPVCMSPLLSFYSRLVLVQTDRIRNALFASLAVCTVDAVAATAFSGGTGSDTVKNMSYIIIVTDTDSH